MSEKVSLSYTTASSYLSCPSRVKFSLDHVKIAKSAPLVYGSVFHKVLASRLKNGSMSVAEAMTPYLAGNRDVEQDWNGVIMYTEHDLQPAAMMDWLEEAVGLVLANKSRPQACELKLSREFDGEIPFRLSGVIDALWNGSLVDFKLVGKMFKPDMLQSATYAILNGGPCDFYYFVIHKEKVPRLSVQRVTETKKAGLLDWTLDRVYRPVAKGIANRVFPANPSYQFCTKQWCPYWDICRGEIE